ncbi:MAG: (Fe-S)-binding protein, partial [Ruegeria sp.]
PPRPKDTLSEGAGDIDILAPYLEPVAQEASGFLGWLDKTLEKL